MYEKAGHRVTEPTNEREEPGHLQLSIRHAKPVFGTDFDVIVEVCRTEMKLMKGWTYEMCKLQHCCILFDLWKLLSNR